MGVAAYNRGSRAIRAQLDREAMERRLKLTADRCLCGAARVGAWTAGVHHGTRRCARVITQLVDVGPHRAGGDGKRREWRGPANGDDWRAGEMPDDNQDTVTAGETATAVEDQVSSGAASKLAGTHEEGCTPASCPQPVLSGWGATAAEASPPDARQCETGSQAPFESASACAERRADPGVTLGRDREPAAGDEPARVPLGRSEALPCAGNSSSSLAGSSAPATLPASPAEFHSHADVEIPLPADPSGGQR